ncbi:MAG TPA: ester cyclase [Nocardioidaceae bacterium]|nr:ester cyclase [Nocardioidaceae bacterium]
MSRTDRNKAAVRRFYDQIWNSGDTSAVPEILAADLTFRGSLGAVRVGHAAFVDYVEGVVTALGDYRCDIDDLLADGDRVVARMSFSGIHRGPLLGVPATGRRVSWAGVAFFTFTDDLIGDLWVLGDLDGLKSQLADTSAR